MRHRLSRAAALLAVSGALAGCPGRGPTDSTPEGAVQLLLQALRFGDRAEAYRVLAPETQAELGRRAAAASEQAGRRLEPAEMLAVERFALRWDLGRLTSEVEGDRATVVVVGSEEGQRATVHAVRADGRWRVVLPLDGQAPAPP